MPHKQHAMHAHARNSCKPISATASASCVPEVFPDSYHANAHSLQCVEARPDHANKDQVDREPDQDELQPQRLQAHQPCHLAELHHEH
eukprot:365807-Chlamydomonas_euryale.AAC.10